MKINSVTLEGFQSYYERERVEVAGMSLAVIVGRNGAGKSTLVDAIEWALWGKFRGEVVKSVISRGAPRAEVTIEFDLNDSTYRVTRTRTSTDRHEVILQVSDPSAEAGWKELTEKNPVQADPAIADLLGMTWATARATWIIGQSDFGTFCELPPSQRRVALSNAFGLSSYADLAESAEAERAKAANRVSLTQQALAALTSQAEALNVEGPFPGLDDEALTRTGKAAEVEGEECATALAALADPALETRAAETKAALDAYTAAAVKEQQRHSLDQSRVERALSATAATLAVVEAEHARVTEAVWEVEDATEAVAAAEGEVTAAEKVTEDAIGAVAVLERQAATLSAEQEGVKGRGQEAKDRINPLQVSLTKGEGECFTCLQPLTAQQVATLIQDLESERGALLAQYRTLGERLSAVQGLRGQAQHTVVEARRAVEVARKSTQRAHQHLAQTVALAERVEQVESSLAAARVARDHARTEFEGLGPEPEIDQRQVFMLRSAAEAAAEKVREAQGRPEHRQQLRHRRDAARETERRVWQEQDRRTRVAVEREALIEPTEEARQAVEDAEKDLRHYLTLRDAFRPSGIPAMVLAGVVEELNDEANDVLGALSPTLSVNVATQREKARGGPEDKVTVYVVTVDGQVDYSTLSGSEKFRIALALRIALSRCVARRTGTPIETIILDEGWGTLDEEFKRAVTDVLIRLSADFTVFTVSHIDDVKDAFPVVISVSKDTGTSRATVAVR